MTTIDALPVIDTDSHVTEPPDLWDRYLSPKWRDDDRRPHVIADSDLGVDRWVMGKHKLSPVAKTALAGWSEFPPSFPLRLEDADPGSWNPTERLKRMDEYGIWAQVLYPNIVAFQTYAFFDKDTPHELGLDCIRAYNDFLADFAAEDDRRLVPIMMLPFWDLDATYKELERAAERGHKGILFASKMELAKQPPIWDPYWSRMFDMASEMELSVNFHIGFSEMSSEDLAQRHETLGDEHTRVSAISMLGNARAIADVICTGICHRHPDLKIVSVESGASWLPYLMESLDWHWKNFGAVEHKPDMELPSFYLKRQVYGTFWFESESLRHVADLLPDNIMFETDFPHPTSLSPGPKSAAEAPRVMVQRALEGLDEDVVRKLLFENAAKLYHVDVPVSGALA